MALQLDDSWEHKAGPMYYQHSQRRWYCTNCEYETKSPKGANRHAAIHEKTLPSHRKKEEKLEIQAQIEPKKERKTETRKRNSIFDTIGKNPHPQPSNWTPEIGLQQQKDDEEMRRILQYKKYEASGLYDAEQLEEKKIELGFVKRKDPKVEMEKQQNREICLMMALNEQDPDERNRKLMLYYYLINSGHL